MNTYLMIAMILANVIAITLVYQFIKKLPKKEVIVFLASTIGTIYILVSIVYWFSGFGVEKVVHEGAKNFVVYLFVPINVILFVPYLASKYTKIKQNQIKKETLNKKVALLVLAIVLVLSVEYLYFRNIQKNINSIQEERQNTYQNETIEQPEENTLVINEIENRKS